jgi:hypothetical protein
MEFLIEKSIKKSLNLTNQIKNNPLKSINKIHIDI